MPPIRLLRNVVAAAVLGPMIVACSHAASAPQSTPTPHATPTRKPTPFPYPKGDNVDTVIKKAAGSPFTIDLCKVIITQTRDQSGNTVYHQFIRFTPENISKHRLIALTALIIDYDSYGHRIESTEEAISRVDFDVTLSLKPGYEQNDDATADHAPSNVGQATCEPERARYSDGSTWTSPSPDVDTGNSD